MVQATGKVKKYQIVVSGILLLNLPVSYILLKLGFSPQSTFVVSILVSFLALIGRLIILKFLENFPVIRFLRIVIWKIIVVFFIAAILPVFLSTHVSNPIKQFIWVSIISVLSVSSTVWFLGIKKSERVFLKVNFLKIILLG